MGEPLAHRVATEGACVAVVDIDAEEAERTAGQRRQRVHPWTCFMGPPKVYATGLHLPLRSRTGTHLFVDNGFTAI